jgi:hypothetical protein
MDPDTLAPTGALGTALIPVATPFGAGGLAQVLPQNPAEVLAALMDFPGSVAMAELLEGPSSRMPKNPEARVLGERLLDDVRARLDALEPLALKPLLGRRGPELPTPDELALALSRRAVVPGCSEAQIAALADSLGAPLREALGTSLRKAQAHVATLRWEIAHDLRVLGPKADRLERLDAALTRSMNAKMGELLDRMEHAAQATFARACAHAVQALGEDRSAEVLASWCEEDGWISRYHERCVRMARALFGHLRRGLEGLVRAAAHAEET